MAKKDRNLVQDELVVSDGNARGGSGKPPKSAKKKYEYILRNKKSRKEHKSKRIVTVLSIVLALLLAGVGIFYGMYTAIKLNSFKVYVDSPGNKVLSLFYDQDLSSGSETLEISGPNIMDNTTLPSKHNKSNSTAIEDKLELIVTAENFVYEPQDSFIAASFFLKNTTGEDQTYIEQLNLRHSTNNVETAIRVMLIRNYQISVYAKAKENGEREKVVPLEKEIYTPLEITKNEDGTVNIEHVGEEPWMAEDFYSDDYIFYNDDRVIKPGEVVRYSIIIWLEGWDEDCTDDKLYGIIQMDFAFVQKRDK